MTNEERLAAAIEIEERRQYEAEIARWVHNNDLEPTVKSEAWSRVSQRLGHQQQPADNPLPQPSPAPESSRAKIERLFEARLRPSTSP